MSTMEVAAAPTLDELKAELREVEQDAKDLREEAERMERRARGLRVKIATVQATPREIKPPPPTLEVRFRDYAMNAEVFSETEALEHLAMPKARFRKLAERLTGEGKLAAIGPVSNRRYAWIKPDHDASAPQRRTTLEAGAAARGPAQAVAGTGNSLTGGTRSRHTRKLVTEAKRRGATVKKGKGGHIKIATDEGMVVTGSTPSNERQHKTEKRLRDLGLAS